MLVELDCCGAAAAELSCKMVKFSDILIIIIIIIMKIKKMLSEVTMRILIVSKF